MASNKARAAIAVVCLELIFSLPFVTTTPVQATETCNTDIECELLFNKNLRLAKADCTSPMDVVEIPNNFGSFYDCEGIIMMESE